jgi:hypothetical protein
MATWTSWYTAPDWYKRELIKYAAKCQVRLTIDKIQARGSCVER